LSAATVVNIDFEDPSGNEMDQVKTLVYSPLTVNFSTTNPAEPFPYRGKYGDPGATGWWCNAESENDVLSDQFYPGADFFLGWSACDPITYDLQILFSLPIDKLEGDCFDMDDGEQFKITACRIDGTPIVGPGSTMTVTPSFPSGGGDCRIQHWVVSGSNIRMVKFEGDKPAGNHGSGIDNLTVTYTYVPYQGPGINKTLKNIGTATAYDVSVVLHGKQETSWRYMDNWKSYFETYYPDLVNGPSTKLTWSHLDDLNTPSPIPPGNSVHVGWRIIGTDGVGKVLDMFWTDINGERIAGSQIKQTVSSYVYYTLSQSLVFRWDNVFTPEIGPPTDLIVENVSYLKTTSPYYMDSLNLDNAALNAALIDIPGTWTIPPGESDSIQIPVTVAQNEYVVLHYKVTGPGTTAESDDWVQTDMMVAPVQIPTLSEWGMIIFVVLLAGWMTFVVVRRWKASHVTAA
jgi:hypothetical protein